MKVNIETLAEEEREQYQLVATAFKPGNLIWGSLVSSYELKSIVETGIRTAKDVGNYKSISPYWISLSLLPNLPAPINYYWAIHKGPKYDRDIPVYWREGYDIYISIVINREKALEKYDNQIKAVGDKFHDRADIKYYEIQEGSVFGISIGYATWEMEPWSDEIRIYTPNRMLGEVVEGITPDLWDGVVVPGVQVEAMKGAVEEMDAQVPVFSVEEMLYWDKLVGWKGR